MGWPRIVRRILLSSSVWRWQSLLALIVVVAVVHVTHSIVLLSAGSDSRENVSPVEMARMLIKARLQNSQKAAREAERAGPSLRVDSNVGTLPRVKIFIYPMPSHFTNMTLLDANGRKSTGGFCTCCESVYGSEVSVHTSLAGSPWITQNADEADFFFVPAYVACLVSTGARISGGGGVIIPDIRRTSVFLEEALAHIRTKYPYWDRRGGADHIWTFTPELGANLFGEDGFDKIRRSVFLVTNAQHSEHVYQPWKDIPIPGKYMMQPIYELQENAAEQERTGPLMFWGGTIANTTVPGSALRRYVKSHFAGEKGFLVIELAVGKKVAQTGTDSLLALRTSTFCLCMENLWAWTPCPYEAIFSGCIPVIVTDDLDLSFEGIVDWRDFSLRVSPLRISEVPAILRAVTHERIRELRAGLARVWRLFYFPDKYAPGHATDMVVQELQRRKLAARNTWIAPEGVRSDGTAEMRIGGFGEEWGFEGAGNATNRRPAVDIGTRGERLMKAERLSRSQMVRSQVDCSVWDPLRVPTALVPRPNPRDKRYFCHGPARILGRRECAWPRGAEDIPLSDRAGYIRTTPLGRDFEVIPNAIRSQASRAKDASMITIAAQATVDRVYRHLLKLVLVWQGPVSLAVLVDDIVRDEGAVSALIQSQALLQRWVDVHFVRRRGHVAGDTGAYYPINTLRNIALDGVVTDWTMVLDIDVVPNACMRLFMAEVANAEKALARLYVEGGGSACPGLLAYIPPALEMPRAAASESLAIPSEGISEHDGILFPKRDAVRSLRAGGLRPMHMYFNLAYMPTDYPRWMGARAGQIYEVLYTVRFEPYFVARRDIPRFNESFVNRGGNFAQLVFHMYAAGYRFFVLPEVFTIDQPHDVSKRAPYMAQSRRMWDNFVYHVLKVYALTPAEDAMSPAYTRIETKLALEVAKFPNAKYDEDVAQQSPARKGSAAKEQVGEQFVLVISTDNNHMDRSRNVLQRYCAIPSLWGVVIIWNESAQRSVDQAAFAEGCDRVPVLFSPQASALPGNLFRPSNIPHDAPEGVFLVDTLAGSFGLPLSEDAVTFAFETWKGHRSQIVGFIPRAALWDAQDEAWKYGGIKDIVDTEHKYHFVLPSCAFIRKGHLDLLASSPENVLELVIAEPDCAEIALSIAVAKETQLPPVWVDAMTDATTEFAETPERVQARGECVRVFIAAYAAAVDGGGGFQPPTGKAIWRQELL